jgi:hypothetical protein
MGKKQRASSQVRASDGASTAGQWPMLWRVRQRFGDLQAIDVLDSLRRELNRTRLLDGLPLGARLVLAAGSRGIPNYPDVLKSLVDHLHAAGAKVLILPAMGSHGGGTGPGQMAVLERLSVSEQTVGAPIVSTMDIESIGTTGNGIRIYADRHLLECDGVIIVNRIKEHTEFDGSIQSGLQKMMAIGLGRAPGAIEFHRHAVRLGYERALAETARFYLKALPIMGGVALIDLPVGGTAHLQVVPAVDIESVEPQLVQQARCYRAGLPLDQVDILIVDRIGKDISGSGMDTKVIGRVMNVFGVEPQGPRISRIFVRDLTPATNGNALGIGLADFTTRRLADQIDWEATNLNCLTAISPEKARLPMTFDHDRQALQAALRTIGAVDLDSVRLLWIRDTLHLEYLIGSPAAVAAMDQARIEALGEPLAMKFDEAGDLFSPWEGDVG